MNIILEPGDSQFYIQSYSANTITIAGQKFSQSLIVTPSNIIADWAPASVSALTSTDFECLLSLNLEVLLLGTGSRLQFPAPPLQAELAARGLGLEIMDTAAACRTFNILSSEKRQVAAALMLS